MRTINPNIDSIKRLREAMRRRTCRGLFLAQYGFSQRYLLMFDAPDENKTLDLFFVNQLAKKKIITLKKTTEVGIGLHEIRISLSDLL